MYFRFVDSRLVGFTRAGDAKYNDFLPFFGRKDIQI